MSSSGSSDDAPLIAGRTLKDAASRQVFDDPPRQRSGVLVCRRQMQLRVFRHIVSLIDAGKSLELASECAAVQPFWIARDTHPNHALRSRLGPLAMFGSELRRY